MAISEVVFHFKAKNICGHKVEHNRAKKPENCHTCRARTKGEKKLLKVLLAVARLSQPFRDTMFIGRSEANTVEGKKLNKISHKLF